MRRMNDSYAQLTRRAKARDSFRRNRSLALLSFIPYTEKSYYSRSCSIFTAASEAALPEAPSESCMFRAKQ